MSGAGIKGDMSVVLMVAPLDAVERLYAARPPGTSACHTYVRESDVNEDRSLAAVLSLIASGMGAELGRLLKEREDAGKAHMEAAAITTLGEAIQ